MNDTKRILHVLHGKNVIVGQSGQALTDKVITLSKTVFVEYIVTPQGPGRKMIDLEKDPDYLNGDVVIHCSGGVLIFILNKNGPMAKQYLEKIGNIVRP